MEEYIWHINLFVFVLLTVCYLYQFVYVLVVLFKRTTPHSSLRFCTVLAWSLLRAMNGWCCRI